MASKNRKEINQTVRSVPLYPGPWKEFRRLKNEYGLSYNDMLVTLMNDHKRLLKIQSPDNLTALTTAISSSDSVLQADLNHISKDLEARDKMLKDAQKKMLQEPNLNDENNETDEIDK